jgi:ureidoglycolate amidohydrolase
MRVAQVRVSTTVTSQDPPAKCATEVQAALQSAAEQAVTPSKVTKLVSRAYHDSLFMSRVARTGMLFIPCVHGYSHRPDEFASGEDMADGIVALALAMAQLAETDEGPPGHKDEL